MLLVGIAVNAFASVGIGILTYISTDSELRGLTFGQWEALVDRLGN